MTARVEELGTELLRRQRCADRLTLHLDRVATDRRARRLEQREVPQVTERPTLAQLAVDEHLIAALGAIPVPAHPVGVDRHRTGRLPHLRAEQVSVRVATSGDATQDLRTERHRSDRRVRVGISEQRRQIHRNLRAGLRGELVKRQRRADAGDQLQASPHSRRRQRTLLSDRDTGGGHVAAIEDGLQRTERCCAILHLINRARATEDTHSPRSDQ